VPDERTVVPDHLPKTHKTRDEGTAVRALFPYNLIFFPSFSLIQTIQPLSSFKLLSKTSITENLQIIKTPPNQTDSNPNHLQTSFQT